MTASMSRDIAQAVYRQLSEDFPPAACRWVLNPSVTWLPVRRVPLAKIDYSNAARWNADEHPAKLTRFRRKLRDGNDKPIVLVMRPGKKTAMVADGHHRAFSARQAARPPLAYVCIVRVLHGPWDEMHAAQKGSSGGVKLASPAPAGADAAQQQQVPPPPPPPQDSHAVLTGVIAGVLATAATVDAAHAALRAEYTYIATAMKVKQAMMHLALKAALHVVMAIPHDRQGAMGPATRTVSALNSARRAEFLLAATKRLAGDAGAAHAAGQSVPSAIASGMARERRFYGQHLEASWGRMDAAARTDSTAMLHGLLLGWNAVLDGHTSAECRAADGRNYRADFMPAIGYPGMVHPHCRCWPSKPFPGAPLMAGTPPLSEREPVLAGVG